MSHTNETRPYFACDVTVNDHSFGRTVHGHGFHPTNAPKGSNFQGLAPDHGTSKVKLEQSTRVNDRVVRKGGVR